MLGYLDGLCSGLNVLDCGTDSHCVKCLLYDLLPQRAVSSSFLEHMSTMWFSK